MHKWDFNIEFKTIEDTGKVKFDLSIGINWIILFCLIWGTVLVGFILCRK